MNKYKKLFGNSIVFAIGNFGSKFINIIMVPLYTIYLTTENYGTVDLIMTLVSLLLPVFSLCIYEGVLRYAMDKEVDNEVVWTNSLLVQAVMTIVTLCLYPLLSITSVKKYSILIVLLLVLQLFQILLSQFIRGIGNVIYYSVNGIIMTLIIAISNIIFIAKLDMGVNGYIYSLIIANIFSILFFVISSKIYNYINFKKIDLIFIKESLSFSMPLIPNTLMWWLINSSSRFFIIYFIGTSANGLYAVSNKVPLILTSIIGIFNQAWQMSAIEEYNSEEKNLFYNKIYENFISVLFLATSGIFIILEPLFKYAIGNDFYESWKYVPFLLIGVVFSSFATFLGTNYVAAKKTKGLVITAFYCGLINLSLNVILIPFIGINGASISSMISFFVLWLLRVKDTKSFIELSVSKYEVVLNIMVVLIQTVFLYLFTGILSILIQIIAFIVLIFINKRFIYNIIYIFKRFRR
ncbi:oligosaccharide flippase family protein [Vagococcus fluvialis]|uniref:lipopolysaccharide biosynthesis protein n=1 Tax=Vagococcus fluvialis TaxID=2738 RepID=UPI0037CFBF05